MSRSHQRRVFILIAVIAVVLVAACQPAATPTPTPRPTATAVPPTLPPTATSAATSEVTAEVTNAVTVVVAAPTEEASAAATAEATMSAAEIAATVQPIEVATMEATPEATMEMTIEATPEATMAMTAEVAAPTAVPTQALGTIIDVAKADGNFGTLLSALDKAGLTATLSGKGPFTVFAPTDAAFAVLLSSMNLTANDLLSRSDLADILKYHVVPGKVTADDLANYRSNDNPDQIIVPTLDGNKTLSLTFAADGTITINGTAKVTLKNVQASNGVIHVIDAVLMPPTPEVATPEATMSMTMEMPMPTEAVTPEATVQS